MQAFDKPPLISEEIHGGRMKSPITTFIFAQTWNSQEGSDTKMKTISKQKLFLVPFFILDTQNWSL